MIKQTARTIVSTVFLGIEKNFVALNIVIVTNKRADFKI